MAHCTHPEGPAHCQSTTCPGRQQYLKMLKTKPSTVALETVQPATLNIQETPQHVQEIAHSVLDYPEEIEFANHNIKGEEYLTLQDTLEDHTLLTNNCGVITWAILDEIIPELPEGYTAEEKILQYNNGVHVAALITTPQKEQYIIDYTAKQYDTNFPTPYIATLSNWENSIDFYVQTLHNDTRKQ